MKRDGSRNEYQTAPIVLYLDAGAPIHGVRPFEIVHIDHTPLKILIHSLAFKEIATSVWITLAIDAKSRAIVGFYLTTESPSYRSCMMVMRDIVRRHDRLPETIVVDNGPEFHSKNFHRVCAAYRCNLKYRPKGKPRFGTVMERVFGTTQSQLIHTLEGNTRLMKKNRAITKLVNPKNFVEWTLPALHGALDMYFSELYGTKPHPAHGEEPVAHLKKTLAETGARNHTHVKLDRLFLIETCPSVDDETRIVDIQRGVKVQHYYYWHDGFKGLKSKQRKVLVRPDPWDPRYCYVLIDSTWHTARSKLVGELRRCTALELQYAVAETSKKFLTKGQKLTPELLKKWTYVAVASNFDARLAAESEEMRYLYEPMGIGSIERDNLLHPVLRVSVDDDADFSHQATSSQAIDLDQEVSVYSTGELPDAPRRPEAAYAASVGENSPLTSEPENLIGQAGSSAAPKPPRVKKTNPRPAANDSLLDKLRHAESQQQQEQPPAAHYSDDEYGYF
ncbi:integrase catalytic domain-containing protein [Janthinobacterium sp. Mn2066]|uniref:integrase catalytic domain-containing protein n=1 Tax=Janthinobacterium sp. Mn2066 TaxID=3395264 RepID=UPI003BC3D7A6